MKVRNSNRKGFTLVEILIVVVILGILAAIVIPQFTNASETAKGASLISQLQTIRSQLELYQVQHNGDYPAADIDDGTNGEWSALTGETEVDGTPGDASGDEFGPYLQQPPINGFENSSTIGAAAAAGTGWVYDATDGSILAVMETAKGADVFPDRTLPDNDIVVY